MMALVCCSFAFEDFAFMKNLKQILKFFLLQKIMYVKAYEAYENLKQLKRGILAGLKSN